MASGEKSSFSRKAAVVVAVGALALTGCSRETGSDAFNQAVESWRGAGDQIGDVVETGFNLGVRGVGAVFREGGRPRTGLGDWLDARIEGGLERAGVLFELDRIIDFETGELR